MSYNTALRRVVEGYSLSEEEARELATGIINGAIPDVIVSAILVALRMKGESPEEIVGFAKAMREKALRIEASHAIDVVGTGGDGIGTLNVSTATAILTSIVHPVAKHGNRAVSGRSGAADVLEALGYRIDVEPQQAAELLRKTGFVFLFAPRYHPAMKNVAPIRKALGIRTIFNVLGPLTNPGGTKRQVIGVFSNSFAKTVAEAVRRLGYEHVVVVHGEPGMDEVSPAGKTHVYEVRGDKVEYYTVEPEDFGVSRISVERLIVSDSTESAVRILRASKGLDKYAEIFIKLNTAFALYIAHVVRDPRDGFEYADQLLPMLVNRIESLVKYNGDVRKFEELMRMIQ